MKTLSKNGGDFTPILLETLKINDISGGYKDFKGGIFNKA